MISLSKIASLSVLAAALASSAQAAPSQAKQECKLAYGSSPFATLTFNYEVVGRTEANWALVNVSVEYTRSSFEDQVEFAPIKLEGINLAKVLNGGASFYAESTEDYAGAEISFEKDDSVEGELAVVKYLSDGPNGFAVFECASFPKL